MRNVPTSPAEPEVTMSDHWVRGLLASPDVSASQAALASKGSRSKEPTAMPGEVYMRDFVTREEAVAILGIKRESLYAYVSRGFIRSISKPDSSASLYLREDVELVKAKSAARAGAGPAAASAMQWGPPVMTTSITEITELGPNYRGELAVELAKSGYNFEAVAEYLWGGEICDDPVVWRKSPLHKEFRNVVACGMSLHERPHLIQGLVLATSALDIVEGSRRERIAAGESPVVTARRLLRTLTGVFGFVGPSQSFVELDDQQSIADGLLRALGVPASTEVSEALNAAFVVVADHELNPATFAARVAASTSADVHCCVGAALNAHQGTLTGRACDRVERLFDLPTSVDQVLTRARKALGAGRNYPGFNHRLYSQGDPRATFLIDVAEQLGSRNLAVRRMRDGLVALESELGMRPSVECGLVMLARAINAPNQVADGIFALGRSAGWVAHVLEQRLAGYMIRPRAQFVTGNIRS